MIRLEHVLDSWKAVRQDTAADVEEFPAAEMDFRATPELMTFGEIARHILIAGEGLTGLLLDGIESFAIPDMRDRVGQKQVTPAGPDPASLAKGLRTSIDRLCAELAGRPADFYSQIVTRMDGQQVTRMEMLQFIKEHEIMHRSQLFLYLRLKGLVPATTRRRLARQAAK